MEYRLITSIGTSEYKEVHYQFGEKTSKTKYSSVALCELYGKPNEIIVFLTKEAKEKCWNYYATALKNSSGVEPEPYEIPSGKNKDEILKIFEIVVKTLEEKEPIPLVLDITFAFRALAFIFFTTIFYLTSKGGLTLEDLFYGAYEQKENDKVPIISLNWLINLVYGYYTIRSFKETGSISSLAKFLKNKNAQAYKQNKGLKQLSKLSHALENLTFPLENALPLELGLRAKNGLEIVEDPSFQTVLEQLPELKPIIDDLKEEVFSKLRRDAKKTEIPLDEEELKRELNLINFYIDHNRNQNALLLMREWLVSLLIWKLGEKNKTSEWLKDRKLEERLLSIWSRLYADECKRKHLTELQRVFGKLFDEVGQLRNKIAHCGFSQDEVNIKDLKDLSASLEELFKKLKEESPDKLVYPHKAKGKLLVSCLGLSPGLLVTALKKTEPDGIFLISSEDALKNLDEILEKSGTSKDKIKLFQVKDPYQGYEEWKNARNELEQLMFDYAEILFNLTGGTSAMQFIIERLSQATESLNLRTKKFICIDKRPPDEQRKNPYVLGEVNFLETEEMKGSP